MGYSFTDLGAEGCRCSLNALFRQVSILFNKVGGHAGESKRPITERTPNFREMERPIHHFLIGMVHGESRCQFLELSL